ncbi:SPOR domain-containing protein [Limnohabitans sp.]|uniref:SPOR domain-containing protein n=2 Tax=Limnohabitans sp. TaxID=1907725 RepID=UPI0033417DC7
MAFFKFRLPGQPTSEPQGNSSNSPAESVDVMRRRARHRLIGASVLVVSAVIVFPLLFDTQPRPVAVDIAVDIPDRATAKPLVDTSKQKPLSAGAGLDAKEEVVPETKPKVDVKPDVAVATTAAVTTTAAVAVVTPRAPTTPEPAKAEPKADPNSKDTGARFVVQAGTFSDEAKLREVRSKLEKAGITTYTQVIEGKEGRRVRVRVGPFTKRDDADKMANKIKQLQLQPQVLTL